MLFVGDAVVCGNQYGSLSSRLSEEAGPSAEGSVPCQQGTLAEIKGQRGPEGKDVDDSSQRPLL